LVIEFDGITIIIKIGRLKLNLNVHSTKNRDVKVHFNSLVLTECLMLFRVNEMFFYVTNLNLYLSIYIYIYK